MSSGKDWLAIVGGSVMSIGSIYFVVSHQPLTEEDFEVVVAKPESVSVGQSRKQSFVEIHLPSDPIRYRIAVERFEDFDDPQGFLSAASRPGSTLRFHIERGARQNPDKPRIDPQPTVFIQSMAVGSKQYYPLSKRIAWDEKNQLYARIIAVLFSVFTAYIGYTMIAEKRKRQRAD